MNGTFDEETLAAAEEALADGVPFGSHDHISARVHEAYAGLLSAMSASVPAASALLDALGAADAGLERLVLGDPLLRRTVEDGACLHLLGRDAIDEGELNDILTVAAEYTRRGHAPLLAKATGCVRVGEAAHHGHVWTRTAEDGSPAARRFTAQCLSRLPGVRVERATDDTVATLAEAVEIVDRTLPRLGRSALSHTYMMVVATTDGRFAFDSLTVPGIPGAIFLSPSVLTSPERAADAVFHESMHLKLMDIDYAEHLFALGFRPQLAPTVSPPWHDDEQQWPLDRLLTAMHVYTGLAVFFGRIANARGGSPTDPAEYPVDPVAKHRRAVRRARFLLDASREHPDAFSAAGRSFIDWVGGIQAPLGAPSLEPR
ncbi:HEXXH motif-containing putative peptide modification protein [Streptomyces sp. NPDC057217]|uniref:aKG-HExxH-type peptide beta-hydroxylase n=1 Tax=Streptomyces sp. NPDC057217 TaxID=3346054 RepID=UPI0036336841